MRVRPTVIADCIAVTHFSTHDRGIRRDGASDKEKRCMNVLALEHLENGSGVRRIRTVVKRERNDALIRRPAHQGRTEKLIAGVLGNLVEPKTRQREQRARQQGLERNAPRNHYFAVPASTDARTCATFARKAGGPKARKSLTICW